MLENKIRKTAFVLGIITLFGMSTPAMAKGNKLIGEYRKGEILTFGESLNEKQEEALREYFGAPEDIEAIYVDTRVAVKQLGLDESAITTYKGGWYSSAYVKLTDKEGIKVTADNLTLVTNDMLANALITSGILNADVIASAPFPVTGESALAGIWAGAEAIMGEELSQSNKETAQKEMEVTLDVADEIGQKEASTIMNEIKSEVIKEKPTNVIEIENIVINITNNYGITLSDSTKGRIIDAMSDINDLDIDYNEVKKTLKDVGDNLFKELKENMSKGEDIGMKIKESGLFEKIGNWINDLWNSFKNLINSKDKTDTPEIDTNLEVNEANQNAVPSESEEEPETIISDEESLTDKEDTDNENLENVSEQDSGNGDENLGTSDVEENIKEN